MTAQKGTRRERRVATRTARERFRQVPERRAPVAANDPKAVYRASAPVRTAGKFVARSALREELTPRNPSCKSSRRKVRKKKTDVANLKRN